MNAEGFRELAAWATAVVAFGLVAVLAATICAGVVAYRALLAVVEGES